MIVSVLWIIACLPLSLFFCIKVVKHYERIVLFRMGRVIRSFGPGTLFVIPCVDTYKKIDLRTFCLDLKSKDIMLSDSIQVKIQAVCWCRVTSPLHAVICTEDYTRATVLLSTGILRRFLGYKTLTEVVTPDPSFGPEVRTEVNRVTLKFGVLVENIDLKAIRLQSKFQQTMATEGISFADARGRFLMSDAEAESAPLLTAAANNLDRTALQLKFMQALIGIQAKSELESTIFFPVPLDFGLKDMVKHAKNMKDRMRRMSKGKNKRMSVDDTSVTGEISSSQIQEVVMEEEDVKALLEDVNHPLTDLTHRDSIEKLFA